MLSAFHFLCLHNACHINVCVCVCMCVCVCVCVCVRGKVMVCVLRKYSGDTYKKFCLCRIQSDTDNFRKLAVRATSYRDKLSKLVCWEYLVSSIQQTKQILYNVSFYLSYYEIISNFRRCKNPLSLSQDNTRST